MLDCGLLPRGVLRCIVTLFGALMVMTPVVVSGQTITAMWDPSPASDQVTGYQVCVGTASRSCNIQLASVATTSYTIAPTGGVRTYVAVRAVNAAGAGSYSAEASFSIPGFPQPANQAGPVGVAIAPLNLSVSDPDGSALTFSHTGLPIGLSLNASTGQISGTPSVAGTYNVTVFVADKLATVSRSFVWTVTSGPTPDKSAPSLAIGSPTSGQTLNSTSVTISGTATDSGTGGSGITKVAVNGQAATGGTTSGNGTASWSRSLTLVSGANTITVEAYDGAGNVSMQQIALNVSFSTTSVTGVSLTASLPSPQNTGTAVKFMAAGSGGVAFEYLFRLRTVSGTQSWTSTVQNWSTSSTYTWTPSAAGSYVMVVFVRRGGSTSAEGFAEIPYLINAPGSTSPLTITGLTSNRPSPQVTGTSITFTASASGGTTPYYFKWWLFDGTTWTMIRDWSTTTTYTWTPTVAGSSYRIGIWARGATTADVGSVNHSVPYSITSALGTSTSGSTSSPPTITGLTSNLPSPQNTGTAIKFMAAGSGGVAFEYLFRLRTVSGTQSWTSTVQNWSTSSTYTWTPSAAGSYVMMVFVRSAGSTSIQTSAEMAYVVNTPQTAFVSAVSVTPSSGSGAAQTFSLQYADSSGSANLATTWVWFNVTIGSTANSCLLYYDKRNATLFLLNDTSSGWIPGTLGTGTTLQNTQCRVALGSSSVSLSGTTLALTLAMTFTSNYTGTKNVYLFAANTAGSSSGWQDRGDWMVTSTSPTAASAPAPSAGVSAVSVTPGTGSGATQVFSLTYSDSLGAGDLNMEWAWFSPTLGPSAANSCLVYYSRPSNTLFLVDDSATVWLSAPLGSGTALQNSQCAIVASNSSVSVSGTTLTLNLAVMFKPAFSGTKNIYMFAASMAGVSSGWQDRGNWIVP